MQAQQRERPEQVELLLDGERPEVQQGRRRASELRGEVVAEPGGEHEVDDEATGGNRVGGQRPLGDRRQEHLRRDHRDDHDDARCRQQTPGAPCPESRQRDRAGRGDLTQQQSRDQKTGEHEEHVDADEPAGEPSDPGVKQDDGNDRDGTQTFDIGPKLVVVVDPARLLHLAVLPAANLRCGLSAGTHPAPWASACGYLCINTAYSPSVPSEFSSYSVVLPLPPHRREALTFTPVASSGVRRGWAVTAYSKQASLRGRETLNLRPRTAAGRPTRTIQREFE